MMARCANCLKEYEKRDKVVGTTRKRIMRRHNSVTCSKKCSREWVRRRKDADPYKANKPQKEEVQIQWQ